MRCSCRTAVVVTLLASVAIRAGDPRADRYEPTAIAAAYNAYLYAAAAQAADPNADTSAALSYAYWETAYVMYDWYTVLDQYLDGSSNSAAYVNNLLIAVQQSGYAHRSNYAAYIRKPSQTGLNAFWAHYYAYQALYYNYTTGAPDDGLTAEMRTLRDAHNAHRVAIGLPRLKVDWRLTASAVGHANWMGANRNMTHTESDGSQPIDRAVRQGYSGSSYGIGENIAYGYPDVPSVFQAWLNSPPHLADIEDSRWVNIGLAVATGTDGLRYWSVEFGYIH